MIPAEQNHDKTPFPARLMAGLKAILLRAGILVIIVIVTWPFVSRIAISNGFNAIIVYYWIVGGCIVAMIIAWLYKKLRQTRDTY
jgi:hypothetical protein